MNKKNIRWEHFLKITKEWQSDKNFPDSPQDIAAGSHKKYWWQCSVNSNHEWMASYKDRMLKGSGCPFCAGRKVDATNSLQATHPEIAKEWHKEKNYPLLPIQITSNSNRKIWWICSSNPTHEWQATCANRSRKNSRCPYCNNAKATFTTSLAQCFPGLAVEWHSTKNEPLTSANILPGSAKRVWWKCAKDTRHEWQATCNNRTSRNTGCPFCRKSKYLGMYE